MKNVEINNENIQTISISDLREKLAATNKPQFWNVLTDEYFSGEMIPGSRRVALDRIGREINHDNLAKDAEIIVYCAGPSCPQSRLAAQKLAGFGYTNVRAFEGGLEEWKETGLEITNQTQSAASA